MAKVKLGLGDLTVLEKGQFGNTVHTSMTGNSNFTTPAPPLTAVRTATDNYWRLPRRFDSPSWHCKRRSMCKSKKRPPSIRC